MIARIVPKMITEVGVLASLRENCIDAITEPTSHCESSR